MIGLLFTLSTLLVIRVPFSFGNKVFFIKIGMFLLSTGSTVGGYNTFAPKCDNSIASKYDNFAIGFACLTSFGLVLYIPLTSVQISSALASSTEAIIAAV